MIGAAAVGFATGFSLILAIGAQNAFVLRQGLQRRHVFALCLFCAVSDAALISAGVAGFGALVALWPRFPEIMALAGAVFLALYGLARFRAAWRGGAGMAAEGNARSLAATLATAAAFTWLNPHVYLDTLGLVGAVSTRFAGAQAWAFGGGAIAASFVFFFGLGYGARAVAPVMARPGAWRLLDTLIGITMWMIAASLLVGLE